MRRLVATALAFSTALVPVAATAGQGWNVSGSGVTPQQSAKIAGAAQTGAANTYSALNLFAKPMSSTAADQIAEVMNEGIAGSGSNGPATSQQGFYIDVQKAGWYAGTAHPGQIEGLRITNRQGGGTGSSAAADTSGETINTQARDDNYGFTNNIESVVSLVHHVSGQTDTIPRQIDTQVGIINVPTGYYGGFVATSQAGANGDAVRLQSNSGASWANFINGLLPTGAVGFTISGVDGSYSTPTGSVSALRAPN